MATPIKETPILYGKDSDSFLKRAKEVEQGKHKVPREEYDRGMKLYRAVMAKATFND